MERTKSQVGKFSKAKGARFESYVRKLLDERFNGLAVFARSPSSGGTIHRGDLVAMTPAEDPRERVPIQGFPFTFELKNRESWTYKSLFHGFWTSELGTSWQQVYNDAYDWNTVPILVFTKNYHPVYVIYDQYFLCRFFTKPPVIEGTFTHIDTGDGHGLIMRLFSAFLKNLVPEVVMQSCQVEPMR